MRDRLALWLVYFRFVTVYITLRSLPLPMKTVSFTCIKFTCMMSRQNSRIYVFNLRNKVHIHKAAYIKTRFFSIARQLSPPTENFSQAPIILSKAETWKTMSRLRSVSVTSNSASKIKCMFYMSFLQLRNQQSNQGYDQLLSKFICESKNECIFRS